MADKNDDSQSNFCMNHKNGEILGRSLSSLLKIVLYMISFCAVLAIFWGLMLWVFYQTLWRWASIPINNSHFQPGGGTTSWGRDGGTSSGGKHWLIFLLLVFEPTLPFPWARSCGGLSFWAIGWCEKSSSESDCIVSTSSPSNRGTCQPAFTCRRYLIRFRSRPTFESVREPYWAAWCLTISSK